MSQRVVTSTVNTNIPGAYPDVTVKSNPVGLGASGNVIIVGEADGGDSYQNVALKDNSFTPDQADRVAAKYVSGPIVDAFRAFAAPSGDNNITGSANRIFVIKTNQGAKAAATLDTDYGSITSKNWGKDGNKIKVQVTQTQTESAPAQSGSAIPAFGAALNGTTFAVRLNGSAATTVTLSTTPADHADVATLVVELNAQLPSGIVASAGAVSGSIKLVVAVDAAANRKGSGKSFELVDTSPGDLASIGLTPGLTVSSAEPAVEVSVSRPDIGLSETKTAAAVIAMQVGYLGTSATMTINQTAKTLVTSVTGGAGVALTLDMTQFQTVADMVAYIASQPGYSASVAASAQQSPTSALDAVTTLPIAASTAGTKPGRVKSASAAFKKAISTSKAVDFVPTATAGLPAPAAAQYLSGGAKGATAAADIIAAIAQMAGVQANIIVPLFSRDATADISEGLTDAASTYTIDAINAAVKSHCLEYSTPELKRNRLAVLSFDGAYTEAKSRAQSLATYRCLMAFQRASQVNSAGVIQSFQPWYTACIAAGMQAGGFYKAIVNKLANIISFTDPAGYDSGSPGDVEDALDAGLLMLTKDNSGNRWVSDQTTYGLDTNFVYNSFQAVYLADILVLDLADAFQKAFVGQSLADVDAATALTYLYQKMDGYKKLKMIASSDDAPLGFKNAKVSINAPTMSVSVEIKLATAIYFIPISVAISAVTSTAS